MSYADQAAASEWPTKAKAVFQAIAARGGSGHWTHALIDKALGKGWSERQCAEHYERLVALEKQPLPRPHPTYEPACICDGTDNDIYCPLRKP